MELHFPRGPLACPPRAPHPTLGGADGLPWGPSSPPDAKEVLTLACWMNT